MDTDFRRFDGEYEKIFYEVLINTDNSKFELIDGCWINDGVVLDGTNKGREWREGECFIRPSKEYN